MKLTQSTLTVAGLALLSSALCDVASAQYSSSPGEKKDSLMSRQLEEVVISANRNRTIRIKTPEAIMVLDAVPVRRKQLRTAPEALMMTPGVFVQKTNHGGGSPFIRGLTGNQTLLLIDGIRLSNATARYGPNQYFNTIDLFGIEKFEILRGSGSVQYGSDAIGGTIQAFTQTLHLREKPEWNSRLIARAGTHGMEKTLNGKVSYESRNYSFLGGITGRDFGDLAGGDTTGRQSPTGYNEFDFDLKGRMKLSQSSEVFAFFQSVRQTDVPVYHKVVHENFAINRMDPQERKLGYLKYKNEIAKGILKSISFTGSWQGTRETRESRKNGSDILRNETDRVSSLSFSAEAVTGRGQWNADSGFEIYNDRVKSTRTDTDLNQGEEYFKRGLYPDGSDHTSLALFSLHMLDLRGWSITGGVRLNSFIINVSDESTGSVTLRPSAVVGNAAVMKKLGKSSGLFISLNNGFRSPNIDDLGTLGIVDFRYETPNYSLKPEHSLQYQAGFKHQEKILMCEVSLYRNELYDLIVRNKVPGDTIEGYPVYRKENVERAYISGFEAACTAEIIKNLRVSGSLTYTFGQNITKNEPARRIPPLFGRISAEYSPGKMSLGLEWMAAAKQDRLAAGDREDNRIPEGGTPGWNVLNLNSGYDAGRISIDISVFNILNRDYGLHGSGVNGMGRSAFLTLTLNI